MPNSRTGLLVLSLGLVLCWVTPALANVAAVRWYPGVVHAPLPLESVAVEVEQETLLFECREVEEGVVCDFEARYQLWNPGAETQEILAAFYGSFAEVSSVTLDDRDVMFELNTDQMRLLDEKMAQATLSRRRPDVKSSPLAEYVGLGRTGMRLAVAGQTRAWLVVKGTAAAALQRTNRGYVLPAVRGRHLAVAHEREDMAYDLAYLVSPIRTWAKAGEVTVKVTWPDTLEGFVSMGQGALGYEESPPYDYEPMDSVATGEGRSASFTLRPENVDRLALRFVDTAPVANWGGPTLQLGGTIGNSGSFRMGLGWEASLPDWLLWGVSAESDFDRFVAVIPYVKVASPFMLVFPSMGLGVGAPTLMEKDQKTMTGLRFMVDWQLGPIGVLIPFDWYPTATASSAREFEFSLFWQISL